MKAKVSKPVPMPATIPDRETGLGEPTAVTSGVHRRGGVNVGWRERAWTCAEWVIGYDALVVVWEFRERRGVFYQAEIECGQRRSLGVGPTAFDALKEAFRAGLDREEDWFRHQVARVVPVPSWAVDLRKGPRLARSRRNGRT